MDHEAFEIQASKLGRASTEYQRMNERQTPDYLIATEEKPVAVHIFAKKVVIVGQDGHVTEIRRDA